MQAVKLDTTSDKFIISIDKNQIDTETVFKVVEILNSELVPINLSKSKKVKIKETNFLRKGDRFLKAQQFKATAPINYTYSKMDVYEQ